MGLGQLAAKVTLSVIISTLHAVRPKMQVICHDSVVVPRAKWLQHLTMRDAHQSGCSSIDTRLDTHPTQRPPP
jgi:hypothetical protein